MFKFTEYNDMRDVTEAYENAEKEGDIETIEELEPILEELAGTGGNHIWRGICYPIRMIREDVFAEYVKELAEDCGFISPKTPWWISIDWERTSDNVRCAYHAIEVGGHTYYCA